MIRHIIRRLVAGALILVALFIASSLLFRVIMPPSTIMLARWVTLQPVMRIPVPLEQISDELELMVIASEDGQFCRHAGVDWRELRLVIESGGQRGASTISMQTAKKRLSLAPALLSAQGARNPRRPLARSGLAQGAHVRDLSEYRRMG